MIDDTLRNQTHVPSIVDRLMDDDPDAPKDLDPMRHYDSQSMHAALKRDLEALLNARRRVVSIPRAYQQTDQSLLSYGLADITKTGSRTEADQADLCRTLSRALTQFEPRLTSVNVTVLENADRLDRTLRFRIEAILNIEPAPELIQFDSFIEPVSTTIRIQEAKDD